MFANSLKTLPNFKKHSYVNTTSFWSKQQLWQLVYLLREWRKLGRRSSLYKEYCVIF